MINENLRIPKCILKLGPNAVFTMTLKVKIQQINQNEIISEMFDNRGVQRAADPDGGKTESDETSSQYIQTNSQPYSERAY